MRFLVSVLLFAVLLQAGDESSMSAERIARPTPNGSNAAVSASLPLYLYSHFRDDDTAHLRLAYSRDAATYSEVSAQGSYTSLGFRDPSVIFIPSSTPASGGKFYFLATPFAGCQVQFISSSDLVHFNTGALIDMRSWIPGCQLAWAPEWWHDPGDGEYYFWISIGNDGAFTYNTPRNPYLVHFNPVTGKVIGTPTRITLNGTTQGNTFDYFPWFHNGIYYIWYVDQQINPSVTQPIAYATASTLTGIYTQQTIRGADYLGLGTFLTEAPALVGLGTGGCVRIMVDRWTWAQGIVSPALSGRLYSQLYRDSCPSAGAPLFSPASFVNGASPIQIDRSEHGTVIPLTDPGTASIVYNAAFSNTFRNAGIN